MLRVYFLIYLSYICINKYTALIYVINVYYYKYPSLIVKFEVDYKNGYKFLSSLDVHPLPCDSAPLLVKKESLIPCFLTFDSGLAV